MKKLIFLFPLLLAFGACSVQGLTNDYAGLPDAQKQMIRPLASFSDVKPGNIYRITGAQLRDELSHHEKSLVYVFTNGCTSKRCKPLGVYERYAQRNGYTLYLVMNGFRDLDETLGQPIESPLYAIDNDHYGIRLRSHYVSYFDNDLLGKPLNEKEKFSGNLYFFDGGRLQRIANELPEG
jgi:hypothetical protein